MGSRRRSDATGQAASWNTLGAAYYRVGDWKNAITALEKSEELAPGELVADAT